MGRDIPLGRFAGIRVGMSWSVPLVAVVYAWSLAVQFPTSVPGLGDTQYWTAAAVAAVLFFVSLLAHEAGHALVARREGIGVEGISLWLMGGVAKLEHEARSAGAELRIAAVGPFASLLTGIVFWFLNQALSTGVGTTELYAEVFGWLAFINVLLAAFNMLPGSPLDGGRVLGALIWMRTRDQTAAQRWSARVGQVLGGALTGVGLLLMLGRGQPSGLWIALVGGYILGNATSEVRQVASLGLLRGVSLAEVMDPPPPSLPEWMTVHDMVVSASRLGPHTAFPVHSMDGRPVGLLTAEAVRAVPAASWPSLRLADLAFPLHRVPTAAPDDPVLVTLQRTRTNPSGRVLVLAADGRIAGIVGEEMGQRALAVQRHRRQATPPPLPGGWTPAGGSGPAAQVPVPGGVPGRPPSRDGW